MRGIFWIIIAFVVYVFVGFVFLKFPLIPLLLLGTLGICVISFLIFGMIEKDNEKKQKELLKKIK